MVHNDIGEDLDTFSIDCHIVTEPEQCKNIFADGHDFKILTFNIRSIAKNFDQFFVLLSRMNASVFDIIILTECWLNATTIIPQLPGYNVHQTTRHNNQNGGVVGYIKSSWNASVTEPQLIESDCLQINIAKSITVLGIYRSPSFRNLDNFLTSLDLLTNGVGSESVIILGDLNVNILEPSPQMQTLEYLCFMAENGFFPAITEPTRGESCLDHIYVKGRNPVISVGIVCKTDITDHDVAMFGTHLNKPKPQRPSRFIFKRDVELIMNELKNINWSHQLSEYEDVNVLTDAFGELLMNTLNKYTRKVKVSRSNYNLKPWITPGIMRCMRHRDKLHLQAKQNPDNKIAHITYTRYRNFFIVLLRKLKSSYEFSELQENKNNPRKLWKTIRNVCNLNPPKADATDLLSLEGCSDELGSLNKCNAHFSSVGQKLADTIMQKIAKSENDLASTVRTHRTQAKSFFLEPTDANEIECLINGLRNNKAPGIDNISNSLLKELKGVLIEPLTIIFNQSMATGVFPESWKLALVCPIHKSGSKEMTDNYRPISLLCAFSKLLEKLVNNRLTKFIDSCNLISDKQFGFRRGKSTDDIVSLLTSTISSHLDVNKCCVGVFLDLAKAFDTVSTPILLRKLESMGIRGVPLNWFCSYLKERRQLVKVGTFVSSSRIVRFGVPQGSILGPTLFTLYINDIHQVLLGNADILCYADDTALLFTGPTWKDAYAAAESGIMKVHSWLQNNLLTLNTKKTMYICFHKTSISAPLSSLTGIKIHSCGGNGTSCDCEVLTRVKVIKYLGVLLDENLSFKAHIHTLSSRIRRLINVMKQLRDVANLETLKLVYFALCQSLVTYCISCWGSAAKTVLIQIERAQRSVLKVMLKKPRMFSTCDVYRESGVLSVRQLFILKTFLSMHKIVLSSENYEDLIKRRVFKLPYPPVSTTFAQRFGDFIRTRVYNKVNKYCDKDLKRLSVRQAKNIVEHWIRKLNYDKTEALIMYG